MDKSQLQRLATQCGFTSGERSDPMFMECLQVFAKAVEADTRSSIKQHNATAYVNAGNDRATTIRNMGKEG